MTELDFDELDQAVSSLMKDSDDNNQPAEPSRDEPVAIVEQPTPVQAPPAPTEAPTNNIAPPAFKRRGRFMDVVRPVPGAAKPGMVAIKRQGLTISAPAQSVADVERKDLDVSEGLEDETVEQTDKPAVQADAIGYAADPAPASEWPDPIDFSNQADDQKDDQPPMMEEVSQEAEEPVVSSDVDDTAESTDTASEAEDELPKNDELQYEEHIPEDQEGVANDAIMESPFLPDAKVEKRPLGGPAIVSVGDAEKVEIGSQTDNGQGLPPELSKDLLLLNDTVHPDIDEADAEPAVDNQSDKAPVSSEPAAETEVAASSQQASGSIYDTNAYHVPIETMPKKKHGWLVVVWILLLLIVGGLSGAAYFYFTTQ